MRDDARDELLALADALASGELELVWCHGGPGAAYTALKQTGIIERTLRAVGSGVLTRG